MPDDIYMRKDSADESVTLQSIRDLYRSRISSTVVFSQLNAVINDIVFKKNINAHFLLFALRYAVDNNIPIRSPYGLHYIVDNYRIKEAWKGKISSETAFRIRREIENTSNVPPSDHTFRYTQSPQTGFSDIFKGGS